MTLTINKEKLISKRKNLSDEDVIQEVPNIYFDFVIECPRAIPEMTDKEFMLLPEISGALEFWKSEKEDLYTLKDGDPLDE